MLPACLPVRDHPRVAHFGTRPSPGGIFPRCGIIYLNMDREATFDRKNRMKSHTHSGASNVRGNLWYSGAGQVFQRWNDNSSSGIWADSLYRYIYDGSLAQEHLVDVADVASAWVYTYNRINTDYLRKPDGPREKVTSDGTTFTDRFLLQDGANISARIIRQTDNKVERMELTSSGDRQSGGSEQDSQVSKLGLGGGFIEGYASSTGITAFFDPLIEIAGDHYLSGIERPVSRNGRGSGGSNHFSSPGFGNGSGLTNPPESLADDNPYEGLPIDWPDCDGHRDECKEWFECELKAREGSADNNPAWGACCNPLYMALCPAMIVEDYNCLECLCLGGDKDDTNTDRGCLCEKLKNITRAKDEELEHYVHRVLAAREICRTDCGPEDFNSDAKFILDIKGAFCACGECTADIFHCDAEDWGEHGGQPEITGPSDVAWFCCYLMDLDNQQACKLLAAVIKRLLPGKVAKFIADQLVRRCCNCFMNELKGRYDEECKNLKIR